MYSTATDLQKLLEPDALRQLADDGPGGATSEEVMAEAIEQADREIDSYLNMVMEVPVDPVPPLAANLSAKIAIYNLHRRRSHLEVGEWGKEYERCVKLLQRIAEGKLTLGAKQDGETSEPENPGRAVINTRPREFPDERLGKY
jgi:phage gp36-like protein